jgi:hypothetical protein
MRRKWIPLQRIYLGSTDCDLDENNYCLDRRGNDFDTREDGWDCGPHLLRVKASLLRDKAGLLRAARFTRNPDRSPEQFVRLSIQELVNEAGLKMRVNIDAA